MKFYVYELRNPFTDEVFYIGKGQHDRMYVHENKIIRGDNTHNVYLDAEIHKIHDYGGTVKYCKIFETDDEEESLIVETKVIERIGLENLCNMQGGGDGRTPNNETRMKISEAKKGRKLSEEHKRKLSEAKLGKKQSTETKIKRSKALKGKPQSKKQKAANKQRSDALTGRKLSEEHKRKLSEAKLKKPTKYWKGKKLPATMKQKISEGVKAALNENNDE